MDKVTKPEWLRPGIWVRNSFSPTQPRAFVMFVTDTGFKYHFERPFKTHSREEGWHTGGEAFSMEGWELAPDQSLSLESVRSEALRRDAVLEALEEGYAIMADITSQWEGRHTIDGQKLLCKMRDAIASATGVSGELVQDNAINPLRALSPARVAEEKDVHSTELRK